VNNGDITILSILGVVGTALAYVVNKWIIPAYKSLQEEIKILQDTEKSLLGRIQELEVSLATLRERYADNALHSRGKKKK